MDLSVSERNFARSMASEALEISSRRNISFLEYSELTTRSSISAISALNGLVFVSMILHIIPKKGGFVAKSPKNGGDRPRFAPESGDRPHLDITIYCVVEARCIQPVDKIFHFPPCQNTIFSVSYVPTTQHNVESRRKTAKNGDQKRHEADEHHQAERRRASV